VRFSEVIFNLYTFSLKLIMTDLIKELCEIHAVSGNERELRDVILEKISAYAECKVDRSGNIIAFKKGRQASKIKLMLAAHMDEVGLIITSIGDTGLLKFATVGGVDPRVILGRRICVGDNKICGVIATKPIHLQNDEERNNAPSIDKLYIDIGVSEKHEASKLVNLGDTAAFDTKFSEFGDNLICSKALDDRIGCAILINLIKTELPFDTYFVFAVQEEVGLRGAKVAAYSVKPDYAIVVEATTAADIPNVPEEQTVCKIGKGAVISFMDGHTIYNRELYKMAMQIAEQKGIKYQPKSAVAGGNDAGAIHLSGEGAKVAAISVPTRYIHSPCCVASIEDIHSVYDLVKGLAIGILEGNG
jgi:putative aminopeptidase FrvX